jgi:hypothetical protein
MSLFWHHEPSPKVAAEYFVPLKPKLVLILFKNSVRTSKKTQPITITKISWLMLFKEIIAVYSEKHMKPINKICGQNAELLIVKAGRAGHSGRAV